MAQDGIPAMLSRSEQWLWNEAIEAAAKAARAPDRAGREWVPNSLWDVIKQDTARDILKLKINEPKGE